MTATGSMAGTKPVTSAPSSSRTPWLVAAIIVLAVVAAVFAGLWLVERNDMATAEADLETTTEALTASEAEVASLEGQIATMEGQAAGLETELAALTPESTVSHELHAATRELYEDFMVAIQDPKADEISAMFAPYASHTNVRGTTATGADEIGEGWVEYGSMTVNDPGALIVNGGRGFVVAAMTGEVGGTSGLLVTRVGPGPGGAEGLVFYDMVWYSG